MGRLIILDASVPVEHLQECSQAGEAVVDRARLTASLPASPVQPDAKGSFFASVLAPACAQLSARSPASGTVRRAFSRSLLARSSQPGTITAAHRPCQTPSRR